MAPAFVARISGDLSQFPGLRSLPLRLPGEDKIPTDGPRPGEVPCAFRGRRPGRPPRSGPVHVTAARLLGLQPELHETLSLTLETLALPPPRAALCTGLSSFPRSPPLTRVLLASPMHSPETQRPGWPPPPAPSQVLAEPHQLELSAQHSPRSQVRPRVEISEPSPTPPPPPLRPSPSPSRSACHCPPLPGPPSHQRNTQRPQPFSHLSPPTLGFTLWFSILATHHVSRGDFEKGNTTSQTGPATFIVRPRAEGICRVSLGQKLLGISRWRRQSTEPGGEPSPTRGPGRPAAWVPSPPRSLGPARSREHSGLMSPSGALGSACCLFVLSITAHIHYCFVSVSGASPVVRR